jgi:thiol-disulfide isomerase/thioredoxin
MNPHRRDLLILGGVAAVAAGAGGAVGALVLQSRSGAAELLSASFPDLSGHWLRLAEWRGRALVCNFWASWCEPCREELPLLEAAQQQHAANGLQIVGIAVDNAANIQKYLKSVKISYPILIAEGEAIELMRRLGNRAGGLPFTVTVDTAGRVRRRKLGAYSAAELEADLAALLR